MQCVSCNAEIPPAFVHAIQTNVCPGCAGPIMTDESKKLMDELRQAMAAMPNDPEGLAGWLLSTYDLFPKGQVEPTNFHRKKSQAAPAVNEFMKRANADKIYKDPKIQALKNAINELQDSEDGAEVDSEEDDDVSQYVARVKATGNKKMTMAQALANSSIMNSDEEMSHEEINQLQSMLESKMDDAAGKHHLVQKQRLKKLQAQRNMIETGSSGIIRRSE